MLAKSILTRDSRYVWHPYTQTATAPAPLPIVRAEGVYLYTEDGRKILDGISSWWVNIHGHSHPRLNTALRKQAEVLQHVLFAGCTHAPAVDLAESLISVLPKGLQRVFYSDNGSTAVEVAVKMAYQYWKNRGATRNVFIALHHGYHGDTVGAMSASEISAFTDPFKRLLFDVVRVASPHCYRCPVGLQRESCDIDCISSLEKALNAAPHSVAAVIVEPMLQGAGGMIVWPAEFLKGVRRLCDQYGTLLIADEVLTGFGRTGRMFACEHAGVTPDIICLSKALTAGYLPLGATATTEEIYQGFVSQDRSKTFFHGHSYTANPLACAVAAESLRIFRDEDVLARVKRLEELLKQGLKPLRSVRCVGDVRVIGGVGIVELETDGGRSGYLDEIGPKLGAEFLRRGVLLRPLGNVLYVMPPYVITEGETDWVTNQVKEVLTTIASDN
ncbi:MAG TPA: adenosylmethionine--8-amino-7-oxononanoate transaminase [Pyrinomonadaceae bacterium]|nr:adenosylmethionine--8-amino-7-oxononanoate transaminase [Pyrinomonadaceae bacterium]